jgi:hypothetical protein
MKKLFTLIGLFAFILGANAAETNLVGNADFESGDNGWTNSGAVSRKLVAPGHESTQAYEVVGEVNKGAQYNDGATNVTISAYELSFWAKGTAGETAKFKVKFTDASSVVVSGTFTQSGVWEFFKHTYEQTEIKTIEKFIVQCGSGTTASPMTFVADDLFYGVSAAGIDPVDPVTPEFTNFPFTEDFEGTEYVISNEIASYDGTTESDSWLTTSPQVFDRFWRGQNTTSYSTTVVDDANTGTKAIKITISTKEATDFRLRTVNIPVGFYKVTLFAKTDGDGLGKAKIGFDSDETNWSDLTTSYAAYSGTIEVIANPNNGTTRLSLFYTADKTVTGSQTYNLWIDDLTIEETTATAISELSKESFSLYPNPTNSLLFIQSEQTVGSIAIYNLSGQKVLEQATYSQDIDVSRLANGIYILSANVDGTATQQRFVKK